MLGWFIRGLLFLSGIITGFFIAHDDNNFDIVQMMIAIGLFTLLAAALAFLPKIKRHRLKKALQSDNAPIKNKD